MTAPGPDQTSIVVKCRIFPLAFLLMLFKTNVTIDGTPSVLPWGEHVFPVTPGTHEIRISFRYFFAREVGENGVTVQVAPGQTVRVTYRSPFVVFMKGTIQVS